MRFVVRGLLFGGEIGGYFFLIRTPNPEPRTPNPEPRTPNPEPRTPNPEPRTMDIERYYARRASEYDEIYERKERQESLRALKQYVSSFFDGRRVLEVACGTGYWSEVIARRCRSLCSTDVNDEVLELARNRLASRQHVIVRRADAYDIAEIPGEFDAGFVGFWYSHLPKHRIPEFLDSFHARLGPGARICIIDNRFVAGNSTPIEYEDEQGNTYQKRRLKDGSEYSIIKNFPTEKELTKILKGRGRNIEVHLFEYYWSLNYEVDR